jgi:hypothetical protein
MRSSRVFVIATLARGGAREVELGCNSVVGDEMTTTRNRLRRQRDGKESTAHHSVKESRRLGYSHWRAERRTLDDFTTQSPTEGHVRPPGRSRTDPSLVRVPSVCSELTPAVFGRRAIGSAVRLLGHGRLSGDSEVGAIDARAVSRLGLGRSPLPGTFLLRGDPVHCHLASPSRGKRGMFENLWGLSNAGTTGRQNSKHTMVLPPAGILDYVCRAR